MAPVARRVSLVEPGLELVPVVPSQSQAEPAVPERQETAGRSRRQAVQPLRQMEQVVPSRILAVLELVLETVARRVSRVAWLVPRALVEP